MFFSGCFQDFSLDVSSLIMMCLHTDFLGLSCLEFTELLESVGICLLSNLGKCLFVGFFWSLVHIGELLLILLILFQAVSFLCHLHSAISNPTQWIFYLNYCVFQKSSKISIHSSLYQFSTHLFVFCFSFLPICFKSVTLTPSLEKMLNSCFKVFGNPTSGSSHH